ARDLGEIHERHGVNRPKVIANASPVAQGPSGVSRTKLLRSRADGSRVGDHAPDQHAEDRATEWHAGEPLPGARDRTAGCVEGFHLDKMLTTIRDRERPVAVILRSEATKGSLSRQGC